MSGKSERDVVFYARASNQITDNIDSRLLRPGIYSRSNDRNDVAGSFARISP